MSTTAKAQVSRMLALVPYLAGRGEVPVDKVARDFGVSTAQIVKDLNVLWFCGLPEAVTGEMIDVDMDALAEQGIVHVDNTEFMSRPFKFTVREALALIVALRTLRESAASSELPVIDRVLAKLEDAAGGPGEAAASVQVHIERPDSALLDTLHAALDSARRLHISYVVPARDERTERDVDPLRLVTAEGHSYLEAWCHRVQDVRLFRLDRVVAAVLLDAPVESHPELVRRDLSAGLFQPGVDDLEATLELERSAAWIAEYYPTDEVTPLAEGRLRVRLRVGNEGWLVRLALREGGAVTIVHPVELQDQVTDAAERALAAYGLQAGSEGRSPAAAPRR